jgi:hypothetical protein
VRALQPIFSLDKKYHKRTLVVNEKTARLEKALMLILKGDAIKVTLKMQVMFMKQLPTIFPRAESKGPFRTASMLVASLERRSSQPTLVWGACAVPLDAHVFIFPCKS